MDDPCTLADCAASPVALFERVIAQSVDADTLHWLIEGFKRYDRANGDLPLERCLKLPTATQRRRAQRDVWLREVAALIDEPQPVVRAREVARQLSAFKLRGLWLEWRDLRDPPPSASVMQRALFHACAAIGNRRMPQWRQVMRAIDKFSASDGNEAHPR